MTALPSWDDLEDTAPEEGGGPDADLLALLTVWAEFWDADHDVADWLIEPLIASGRGHAMFAPGGTGKSLLGLWLAAQAATGGAAFGNYPQQPINVLYLDYEMTSADLAERLENMGYGPETDLTHLHYATLPTLPPLNHPEGGKALTRLAELVDAKLVVIDTNSRAVEGDENDANTMLAFYKWTGIHLKAAGRAFLRIDHAGKDAARGQRGSSAKNDDVDIVWQMTKGDVGAFTLKITKGRQNWIPAEVAIVLADDPVRYTLTAGGGVPAGTREVMDLLVRLGVPWDAGNRKAGKAVRESGRKVAANVLRAAVNAHRQEGMRLEINGFGPPKSVPNPIRHAQTVPDSAQETARMAHTTKQQVDGFGTPSGTLRHASQSKGGVPPLRSSGTPQDRAESDDSEPPSSEEVGL